MREKRNVYRVLVGKPKGKGDIGVRWEYNIKIDLKEIGWQGVGWIDVGRDMEKWWVLLNLVINIQVSQNCGQFFDWLKKYKLLSDSAPWNFS
jgi:hypothetical protein